VLRARLEEAQGRKAALQRPAARSRDLDGALARAREATLAEVDRVGGELLQLHRAVDEERRVIHTLESTWANRPLYDFGCLPALLVVAALALVPKALVSLVWLSPVAKAMVIALCARELFAWRRHHRGRVDVLEERAGPAEGGGL
jgi:hypothetical protein